MTVPENLSIRMQQILGLSLRASHQANWPAVRMILPVWSQTIERKVFLIKKFSLKSFALNEILELQVHPGKMLVKHNVHNKLMFTLSQNGPIWNSVLLYFCSVSFWHTVYFWDQVRFLIPVHKMFGLQVPHVVRLKTLICKAVGVLFSVAGGKETKNITFVINR